MAHLARITTKEILTSTAPFFHLFVYKTLDPVASSALLLIEKRGSKKQRRDRRFCDTVISRVETADSPIATIATFLYYES